MDGFWSPPLLEHEAEKKKEAPGVSRLTGSSRVVAHPGLPQIRTCRFPAYGSSGYAFAARQTEWTGIAGGNG